MENSKKFRPDPKLRLMDQVRQVLRYHHYAYRTKQTYCDWIMRYILWLPESTAYPCNQILKGFIPLHMYETFAKGLRVYGSAMKILLPTGKIAPVRR